MNETAEVVVLADAAMPVALHRMMSGALSVTFGWVRDSGSHRRLNCVLPTLAVALALALARSAGR